MTGDEFLSLKPGDVLVTRWRDSTADIYWVVNSPPVGSRVVISLIYDPDFDNTSRRPWPVHYQGMFIQEARVITV